MAASVSVPKTPLQDAATATATAAPAAQDATASGSRSAGGKDASVSGSPAGADPAWASDATWQRMRGAVAELLKCLKVLELCG
eukprot:6947915-Prorocentrum_lima.AAC.1